MGKGKTIIPYVPTNKRKVLFLCKNDWSNVGYRLSEAINKYSNWSSRCIVGKKHPFGYDHDIVVSKSKENLIRFLMRTADVVIYVSSFYNWKPFDEKFKPGVLIGIWHGGSQYRLYHDHYNKNVNPNCDFIFAHRDLEGFGSRIKRLQAPYKIDETPIIHYYDKIKLCHSPSNPVLKNTPLITEAFEILHDDHGIEYDIITKVSADECLERKKKCNVFVDQVPRSDDPIGTTIGYGLSLLEAAGFGSVCMSGCNYPDTPIISVRTVDDIIKNVLYLRDHTKEFYDLRKRSFKWVKQTHGYEYLGKYITSLFDVYMNKRHPKYKHIRDTLGLKGIPSKFTNEIAYIRDCPTLQNGEDLPLSIQNKLKPIEKYISPTIGCGIEINKNLFKTDIPFEVIHNFRPYVYSPDQKRDEFVYIDNSSMTTKNYHKIASILRNIERETGLDAYFISMNFPQRIRYRHKLRISEYDFGSRFGLTVDALDKKYAGLSMCRKFMTYIMAGMVPVNHVNFKTQIEFCREENINQVIYDKPDDLKKYLDVYPNQNKYKYTLENNLQRYMEFIYGESM